MITIATLRAAGLSDSEILQIIEIDQTVRLEKEREQSKIRSRNYRDRHRVTEITRDARDERDAALILSKDLKVLEEGSRALPSEGPLEISLVATAATVKPKTKRAKPVKTTLPDDWQPIGPQRDPTEADEFRDKARANGWTYADWHAGYRNYQRHADYNHRNKPSWQSATARDGPEINHALLEEHRRNLTMGAQGNGSKAEIRRGAGLGETRPGNVTQLRPSLGVVWGEDQNVEGQLALPKQQS